MINRLIYSISICLIYVLSILPIGALYFLANIAYFILYYLTGYRRKVVQSNLEKAFPEKSIQERKTIEKAYYHHLANLLMEHVWAFTASDKEIIRRCKFQDLSLFDRMYEENRSFIVVMGHMGNWEWSGLSMSILGKHQLEAIYKPLTNKYFDQYMKRFRAKFGTELIPVNKAMRHLLQQREKPVCTTFIADQAAPPEHAVWTMFLHQETGFFNGYESIARKLELPVVYVHVEKVKRGYYQINTTLISENAALEEPDGIVLKFSQKLEESIRKQPENWLWSHKRWKHKRPENKPLL